MLRDMYPIISHRKTVATSLEKHNFLQIIFCKWKENINLLNLPTVVNTQERVCLSVMYKNST